MSGKNLANINTTSWQFSASAEQKPCIFISYISIDKEIARRIGDYIMNKGDINIYLDIYDSELQIASLMNEPSKITNLIEKGLISSTHLLCLVSNDTKNSWWVPYEIGFAKSKAKGIASLKIKGTGGLPAYLKIGKIVTGIESLNSYLKEISSSYLYTSICFSQSLDSKSYWHPLAEDLDQY